MLGLYTEMDGAMDLPIVVAGLVGAFALTNPSGVCIALVAYMLTVKLFQYWGISM